MSASLQSILSDLVNWLEERASYEDNEEVLNMIYIIMDKVVDIVEDHDVCLDKDFAS